MDNQRNEGMTKVEMFRNDPLYMGLQPTMRVLETLAWDNNMLIAELEFDFNEPCKMLKRIKFANRDVALRSVPH